MHGSRYINRSSEWCDMSIKKTAVILCGGLGTRLKPFTDAIPKPLLPVGEKAVLEIQIERLRSNGFERIVLATNYKADYIEKFLGDGSDYGVELVYSKEKEALGTAGPLSLCRDLLTSPFLVMNGDILSLVDYADMYNKACSSMAKLTVGIKKMTMPFSFGNIFFEGDRVTGIEEKPDITTYALAGIYVMTPEILSYIPDNTYYGMDTLINDMLAADDKIVKYEIESYWLDIGRVDDYERAQRDHERFNV